MADIAALKKHLIQRREALRQAEQKHESRWKELRDYVNPFRGRFGSEKPDDYKPSFGRILDSTPLTAMRMLSAGMQSGLTSPSRQWFKLTLHDDELSGQQAVQEWCDEVQQRMMRVMASSGFYKALHSLYEEVALFGTAALVVMPDYDHVISCRTLTAGTYYLGKAAHDRIDSLYRDVWMTAGGIAAEFGEENVSETIRTAASDRPDDLYQVYHAIEPDTLGVSGREYLSVYWEAGSSGDTILRVGGYDRFPVMAPRWTAADADVYGYGPASEALPDIKLLTVLTEDFLKGLDKQVNPPLLADSSMLVGGVKTFPGGITYGQGGNGASPLVAPLYAVELPLSDLHGTLEQRKNDIRKSLYVDLFMMLSDQDNHQMTAREVAERHEEKMLALGPVLESLEWELLIPAIDRVFSIMDEAGLIPEPPQEAAGEEVKIEFVSVLAQAQKMMGLSAIEQSVAFAGEIAKTDPSVLDVVDTESVLRKYVEMIGAPADILRQAEEVEELRAQRQAEQRQMQQMAQEQQAAQTAATAAGGARDLAQIPAGGAGSALDALIGPITEGLGAGE